MTAVATVGFAELERLLATSPVPVLVDCYAPWCAPCKELEPLLDGEAERRLGRLRVVRVDAEAEPAAAARFDVRGYPTLALVGGNRTLARLVGGRDEAQLRAELDLLLELPDLMVGGAEGPTASAPLDADPTPAGDPLGEPSGWDNRSVPPPEPDNLADQPSGVDDVVVLDLPDDGMAQLQISVPGRRRSVVPAAGRVEVPADAALGVIVNAAHGATPADLAVVSRLPVASVDSIVVLADISDHDLAPIAALTDLRRVWLASTELTGAGLRHVPASVTLLHLDCPNLSDVAGAHLGALASVESLTIAGADGFGDAGLAGLVGVGRITELAFCAHSATDAGVANLLAGLPGLQSLDLCVPAVAAESLAVIRGLGQLTSLVLELAEPMADPGQFFAALPDLVDIAVYGPITPALVSAFGEAPRVNRLLLPDDVAVRFERDLLGLRRRRPEVEINGVWLAPSMVEARLSHLT